ncbi:DUF4089 domain-containing protein [Ancylobacter radicis]|nr:DUF4089 domain-containing protein [Ancylobacter radicis]
MDGTGERDDRARATGALLDGGLALQGLPLEETLRPRVVMHLETAIAMAALVAGFALPDDAEPAPVYRP